MPYSFYWLPDSKVAGMGRPQSPEDLTWLRENGVQVIITLTHEPLPKRWIDDAGLMSINVPIHDFEPPTLKQFETIINSITAATKSGMGVAVHCMVGRGRTGTALAGYLASQGMTADDAIATIRKLRPGSVETRLQEEAVRELTEIISKKIK